MNETQVAQSDALKPGDDGYVFIRDNEVANELAAKAHSQLLEIQDGPGRTIVDGNKMVAEGKKLLQTMAREVAVTLADTRFALLDAGDETSFHGRGKWADVYWKRITSGIDEEVLFAIRRQVQTQTQDRIKLLLREKYGRESLEVAPEVVEAADSLTPELFEQVESDDKTVAEAAAEQIRAGNEAVETIRAAGFEEASKFLTDNGWKNVLTNAETTAAGRSTGRSDSAKAEESVVEAYSDKAKTDPEVLTKAAHEAYNRLYVIHTYVTSGGTVLPDSLGELVASLHKCQEMVDGILPVVEAKPAKEKVA